MDTRIIEARKNIVISRYFDVDTSKFSEVINIDFIPDEVSVKLVNFSSEPGATDCYGLYTDLVSDILVSFLDTQTAIITPHNLIWTLRKPVRGIYNFSIMGRDVDNNLISDKIVAPAIIFLHLEFIKYRTDLPDKVF